MRIIILAFLLLCTFRVITCKECGYPAGYHRMDCSRYQYKDRVAYKDKGYRRVTENRYVRESRSQPGNASK